MQFPTLTTRDLNGRAVTLPADLEGGVNILLVAYTQWQQAEVDTWLGPLGDWEREWAGVRVYELPVVGRMGPAEQRRLDGWMRWGIPDVATRARTLTLYVDRTAFRAALGIPTEDTVAVVAISRDGTVLWRGLGPYDPATARSLRDAVAAAVATN